MSIVCSKQKRYKLWGTAAARSQSAIEVYEESSNQHVQAAPLVLAANRADYAKFVVYYGQR